MFGQLKESVYLTKGEKSVVLAYVAVMIASAGLTVLIVLGLDQAWANLQFASPFTWWVVLSGAVSGGIGLFAARGWMGKTNMMGIARAIIGSIVIAFVASVVAGTLIHPLDGTVFAPVLLLTTFIEKAWLALSWLAVVLGAHHLMTALADERALGYGRGAKHRAVSQLSSLSRAQLYHRK